MVKEIFTYDPKKKKYVKAGVIRKETFVKPLSRSKHYLRIVSGYAIQEDVIEQIKPFVDKIRFQERDTGEKYEITLVEFILYSRPWTHGHGRQLTISEKYFTKVKPRGKNGTSNYYRTPERNQ